MGKAKKQRILYKDGAGTKVAELEGFLFGARDDPTTLFEREREEGAETVADLVQQARSGGLLHDAELFFEDTRGAAASGSDSELGGDGDREGRARVRGAERAAPTAGARAADLSGSEDGEDDEEEEDGGDAEASDEDEEGEDGRGEESGDNAASPASGSESGDEEEAGEGQGRGRARGGAAAAASLGRRGATGQQAAGPGRPGAGRGAAWEDPDDANVAVAVARQARLRKLRTHEGQDTMGGTEYEAALRRQHAALNPRTAWAKKRAVSPGGDDAGEGLDAEAEALLASAGGLVERPAGRPLPAGQLETTRLKDANTHAPSASVVQAVQFHANGQLFLAAGLDKTLRLFQVDGLRNPLLQGVHLDDMPVTAAAFVAGAAGGPAAGADRVLAAGRRPFVYLVDLGGGRVERLQGPAGMGLKSLERFAAAPAGCSSSSSEPLVAFIGDGGFIPLLSLRSRQWVGRLKMSGGVRALTFSADGQELLSTGDDGVVALWDLRTRRCRLTFADSGNVGGACSLAVSADGAYIATGAKSGVVNVYRSRDVQAAAAARASAGGSATVAPARELMNLTTQVDTLAFSPDSQMLAFASRMKRDALRVVHLPSLTVFANWPTQRSPLHYVHSLDFSPRCGLLAIGNAKGRALLYRLHHYQQA